MHKQLGILHFRFIYLHVTNYISWTQRVFFNFSIFRTLFSVKYIHVSFTTKNELTSVTFKYTTSFKKRIKNSGILHFGFMFYISTSQVKYCGREGVFNFSIIRTLFSINNISLSFSTEKTQRNVCKLFKKKPHMFNMYFILIGEYNS